MSVKTELIKLDRLMFMQEELDKKIADKINLNRYNFHDIVREERDIALLCEIMEAVNELGHIWKYWKESAVFTKEQREKALKEIVDVLHFYLSTAIYLQKEGFDTTEQTAILVEEDFESQIKSLVKNSIEIRNIGKFNLSFAIFRGLIDQLDYTWWEVEQAYIEKNQINHERVKNGY